MKINDTLAGYIPAAQHQRTGAASNASKFDLSSDAGIASGGEATYAPASSRKLALALSEMTVQGDGSSRAAKAKASGDAADQTFMRWSKMSAPERLRAQILESHGLNEETLKALSKEKREEIEREIQEAIKRNYGATDDDTSAQTPSET